jgi:hypothetical protein
MLKKLISTQIFAISLFLLKAKYFTMAIKQPIKNRNI